MSLATLQVQNGDIGLTIRDVLQPLVKSGRLSNIDAMKYSRSWTNTDEHPLTLASRLEIQFPQYSGKFLTVDQILEILSKHWGINYKRVDLLKVNLNEVASILPLAYVSRLGIVPIEVTKEKIVILTSEPLVISWHDEVKNQVKRPIEIRLALKEQIKHLHSEIYIVQNAFLAMAKDQGKQGIEKFRLLRQGKMNELDALIEKSKSEKNSSQGGHLSKIVDWLINFALMERASDIHLEPKKGLSHIRFRIDSDLRTVYRMDNEALMVIIARFKVLSGMKLDEKRRPQDGAFKKQFDNGKQIEMRLATLPTHFGEKMVIRLFDKHLATRDLDFIGFHDDDLKTWEELINQPQGLILVTGPTGSGKTTTLYSTLSKVATPEVNVCTAEDPVEMEVDHFNQVQVNPQLGLTFAECIRSFLRQDPDIIMVGEIRDYDTGEMAIQSSLTGHLVFSTLHTNGALATIQRLVDLGLPTFLINSSLIGILSQRLVKRLCSHCKTHIPTPKDKWIQLLEGENLPVPENVHRPVGCPECKYSGYLGRICVYELVQMHEKIREIIQPQMTIGELRKKSQGMFASLRLNGARKILSGETSMDEIFKIIY